MKGKNLVIESIDAGNYSVGAVAASGLGGRKDAEWPLHGGAPLNGPGMPATAMSLNVAKLDCFSQENTNNERNGKRKRVASGMKSVNHSIDVQSVSI